MQTRDWMARTPEFDYTTALDGAMHLFWKTGYAGTSLRDLLKKMKIGEGSFYNTFMSKKNTYLECLKHYNATVNHRRAAAFLSAPTAAMGIRAFFKAVFDQLDDPGTPSRVCMMAATLTHEVLIEPDLRKYVQQQKRALNQRLIKRFHHDKQARLLPAEFDPELVVPILVTYLQGLWRQASVAYDRSDFERQTEAFLTGLGL
jgi:TetR/AcrR family transcriptional repressor of nem operon